MATSKNLGALVREARVKVGITSGTELSVKMGKPPQWAYDVESGKRQPTRDEFVRLARLLKVDLLELIHHYANGRLEPFNGTYTREVPPEVGELLMSAWYDEVLPKSHPKPSVDFLEESAHKFRKDVFGVRHEHAPPDMLDLYTFLTDNGVRLRDRWSFGMMEKITQDPDDEVGFSFWHPEQLGGQGFVRVGLGSDIVRQIQEGQGRGRYVCAVAIAHAVLHLDLILEGRLTKRKVVHLGPYRWSDMKLNPAAQAHYWACAFLLPTAHLLWADQHERKSELELAQEVKLPRSIVSARMAHLANQTPVIRVTEPEQEQIT